MQIGITAGYIALIVFAVAIFCFNWLYRRRVAKTQESLHAVLPLSIQLLLKVSFLISLSVMIILSGLLLLSL